MSVVTPVYNGGPFHRRVHRERHGVDLRELAPRFIDNVSTDGTGEIARRYAALDARIPVESPTDFLPLIANWNRAIDAADPQAAYVKVVHADDRIFPESLRLMVDVAERHSSVDLVGSYRLDGRRVNLDGVPLEEEAIPGRRLGRGVMLS